MTEHTNRYRIAAVWNDDGRLSANNGCSIVKPTDRHRYCPLTVETGKDLDVDVKRSRHAILAAVQPQITGEGEGIRRFLRAPIHNYCQTSTPTSIVQCVSIASSPSHTCQMAIDARLSSHHAPTTRQPLCAVYVCARSVARPSCRRIVVDGGGKQKLMNNNNCCANSR